MPSILQRLRGGARRLRGELSPPLFDPPIRALLCTSYAKREEVALGLTLSGMVVRLCLDAAEGLGWLEALARQAAEHSYHVWRAELARVGASPRALRPVDDWLAQRPADVMAPPAIGALILDDREPAAHARELYPALMAYAAESQIPLVFYPRALITRGEWWSYATRVPANVLSWPPRPDDICKAVELIGRERLTSPDVSFERYFRGFSPE